MDRAENELQDLLASLKTKMKKEPSLQALVDKAEDKINNLVAFMKDSRMKIATWDVLEISDVVPDKVLEDVEHLINEQVGFVDNAKICKKRMQAGM